MNRSDIPPPPPLARYDRRGSLAVVTLNRPERHNALIPELLTDLRRAVAAAADDRDIRAAVITGAGPNFSTGGDVAEFARRSGGDLNRYTREIVGALNAAIVDLLRLPVPTIAAVTGVVTGGALGLVLACDVVVASAHTTFTPWYVRVGYSPDGGWTALLPGRVGRGRATWWQLTNATVDAATAEAWGLVNEVSPDPQRSATETATRISAMRPGAVRRTIGLLRPPLDDVAAALDAELHHFVEQITTDEARIGMREFSSRARGADRRETPRAAT